MGFWVSQEIKKASINNYSEIYNIAVAAWKATYTTILSLDQMDYMLNMMYSKEAIDQQITQQSHEFLLAFEENEA